MCDNSMYFIMDGMGNYYKTGKKNGLVKASSKDDAGIYGMVDANRLIGGGKKAFQYFTVLADEELQEMDLEEELEDYVEDSKADFNWEESLNTLYALSNHMLEYQNSLNQKLSDVDKEISDILHYVEFIDLSDKEMVIVAKLLKEKRHIRRQVKNEMEKCSLLKSSLMDTEFEAKIGYIREQIDKMEHRKYTPRKLFEMFEKAN